MKENKTQNRRINFKYHAPFSEFIIEFDLNDMMFENKICEVEIKFNDIIKKTTIDIKTFENLFDDLLKINFTEIVISSGLWGRDGSNLDIYFEYASNFFSVHIWSHEYDIEERGLTKINNLFNKVLKIFNINRDLILNNNLEYDISRIKEVINNV